MPITQLDEYLRKVTARRTLKRGVAIGDSWFQYPLRGYGDIQHKLATKFRRNVAFLDDSVPGRDAKTLPGTVLPRLNEVAAYLRGLDKPIQLMLVSCGGNDVIGRDFADHLKVDDGVPGPTPYWPWNTWLPDVALAHIDFNALNQTFRKIQAAYEGVFEMRNAHAPEATIIGHTYGDVTPSNRPYQFFFMKSGPWLWKPMEEAGLKDADAQRELVRWLLGSFHALLGTFAQTESRFVLLDTRQLLPEQTWWDNEIHPTDKGFRELVDKHWAPAVQQALQL